MFGLYTTGKEVLAQGLSRGARILLAGFAGLFGAGMAWMAPHSGAPLSFYLFSAFCFAIVLACCLNGRTKRFFGRLIGAAVFIVTVWYCVEDWPHIRSIVLFWLAGLPGLCYACLGRFYWRK